MSGEALCIRDLAEGVCEIHDWPDEGLAARLILAMRRKHDQGGITVCRDCVHRARASLSPRAEGKPSMEPTKEQINAAETTAAHRAMEVFVEVLREELGKLGCKTIIGALGRTEHVHYIFFSGEEKGVAKYTFVFDDSPFAMTAALDHLKKTRAR
jgi:hypothetical protein